MRISQTLRFVSVVVAVTIGCYLLGARHASAVPGNCNSCTCKNVTGWKTSSGDYKGFKKETSPGSGIWESITQAHSILTDNCPDTPDRRNAATSITLFTFFTCSVVCTIQQGQSGLIEVSCSDQGSSTGNSTTREECYKANPPA